MIIGLKKFAHRGLLRGRIAGRKHFAELSVLLSDVSPGQVVFVDFQGIAGVNASWLNAAIAEFFRWAADERNDVFPILLAFPAADLDELELVAKVNGHSYPLADSPELPIRLVHLVGSIDETLVRTLAAVLKRNETTGAALGAELHSEEIGPTGWNNRLKALHDLRLVSRRKVGRKQFYRPIAERIEFNG